MGQRHRAYLGYEENSHDCKCMRKAIAIKYEEIDIVYESHDNNSKIIRDQVTKEYVAINKDDEELYRDDEFEEAFDFIEHLKEKDLI